MPKFYVQCGPLQVILVADTIRQTSIAAVDRSLWDAPNSCTRRYERLGWGIGIGDSQCCWSEAVGRTEAALRSANCSRFAVLLPFGLRPHSSSTANHRSQFPNPIFHNAWYRNWGHPRSTSR
ncbi:hypothetical protein Poly51_18420 [Rubripirellula tenax]|uniref:Uncharacterized protein n=1 Tax=Rubripirellula tenax TaxID=2528015 RepID=A0A5C6FEB9_9BACT|nr:hypothetical protein Poly51_18420 [Rubripirellula tenax]